MMADEAAAAAAAASSARGETDADAELELEIMRSRFYSGGFWRSPSSGSSSCASSLRR
jgi:hypothetical protein